MLWLFDMAVLALSFAAAYAVRFFLPEVFPAPFGPSPLQDSLVLLAIVAMLAALLPARRAANTEIVDALGHV